MRNSPLATGIWCPLWVLLLATLFLACDRRKDDPGWDYFPDMAYSQAYETNSAHPELKDGKTMLTPVKGTVPRNAEYFPYEKTPEDLQRAGEELVNPFEVSDTILARGKYMYDNMCMNCHGASGDGKGFLYSSGKYPFPPASLITERALGRKDGELYHIISVGYGVMGAHNSQISPDDRWSIVHYLNEVVQHSDSLAKK